MKKLLLGMAAIGMLATASCKKDNDDDNNNNNNNTPQTKTQILTSGQWRITSSVSEFQYPAPIGTQTIDIWATAFQPCMKDNLYKFNTNNTATIDEGPTKCNSNDPQSKTNGTWALLNNDTQLQVGDPGNPILTNVAADILQLDNNNLKLKYVTTLNGITATTTTTYEHIN